MFKLVTNLFKKTPVKVVPTTFGTMYPNATVAPVKAPVVESDDDADKYSRKYY